MRAFGDCHIAILDDRSSILVQHVLLAKLAERSPSCKHHVRGLVEGAASLVSALLLEMTYRATLLLLLLIGVSVDWALGWNVVVVENY